MRPMHVTPSIKMIRNLLLTTLASAILFACSQHAPNTMETRDTDGVERTVKEVTISSGTPMTVADLSIEGMSCEMMCGGSIRKALAKLPGVTVTEIRYSDDDVRDHAIVTYDDSKVSDAQMIETIHGLHGGQYKVLAVDITKQVTDENAPRGSKEAVEDNGVSVYAPSISIVPALLALLTQIMKL